MSTPELIPLPEIVSKPIEIPDEPEPVAPPPSMDVMKLAEIVPEEHETEVLTPEEWVEDFPDEGEEPPSWLDEQPEDSDDGPSLNFPKQTVAEIEGTSEADVLILEHFSGAVLLGTGADTAVLEHFSGLVDLGHDSDPDVVLISPDGHVTVTNLSGDDFIWLQNVDAADVVIEKAAGQTLAYVNGQHVLTVTSETDAILV